MLVLAGCKQVFGLATPEPRSTDAMVPVDTQVVDAARDAPSGPACGTSDPSVVLCLEFDEPGLGSAIVALDGSPAHNNASISGITLTTRDVPVTSQALELSLSSSVTVPPNADLAPAQFTSSAWIAPAVLGGPGPNTAVIGGSFFELDLEKFNGNGYRLQCTLTTSNGHFQVNTQQTVAEGAWAFIACTYDGMQLCGYAGATVATVAVAQCTQPGGTVAAQGSGAIDIGRSAMGQGNYIGGVDSVRLFTRALTAAEVCTDAGFTGC